MSPQHSLAEGAVASWPNQAGSLCQKLSEVGVRAPAMLASEPGWRSRLVNHYKEPCGPKNTIDPHLLALPETNFRVPALHTSFGQGSFSFQGASFRMA